ncbi:MAG TPA: methyltransferase domain-containing protein [Methanoculleus sp.]|nr:methyltransferase domain-containing protein [Methanoculleus sp.]
MIHTQDRVILIHEGKEYYVTAGKGKLSTDKGMIDLSLLPGMAGGETIASHLGTPFFIRIPRPTDFFCHARRTGAPMMPKDIGIVCAMTGMNRRDRILDAGTGSGVAAIFYGGIAGHVTTYEVREDFAERCRKNIADAGLENVEVVTGDVLCAEGAYDIVHFDLHITAEHVRHAHRLLSPGGYLACYTPFLEQTFTVMDTARELFAEVVCHEILARELTRSERGTRPSTRVGHTGYITIARKN